MTSVSPKYSGDSIEGYPRRARWTIWGTVLSLTIVIGVAATAWYLEPTQPPPQSATSSAPVTLVLLGVDSRQNPEPLIEAVWLVKIRSDYQVIELLGLPPAPFRNLYTPEAGLTQDVIQPYISGKVEGAIIFDHNDLIQLTDRLGGGWLNGNRADGVSLDNFLLGADSTRPVDVLARQAAVIQGILAEMSIRSYTLNLASLSDIPNVVAIDREQFYDLMLHCSPIMNSKILIRVRGDGL